MTSHHAFFFFLLITSLTRFKLHVDSFDLKKLVGHVEPIRFEHCFSFRSAFLSFPFLCSPPNNIEHSYICTWCIIDITTPICHRYPVSSQIHIYDHLLFTKSVATPP